MNLHDPDNQRGIHYAESLDYGTVHHPSPDKIKRYHQEWEGVGANAEHLAAPSSTGYLNDMEMDCYD